MPISRSLPKIPLAQDPPKKEWLKIVTPEEQIPVQPGSKSDGATFSSMAETIAAAKELDFHDLDPYVASVASGTNSRNYSEPSAWDREVVYLDAEPHYDEPIPAELNLQHGPDAPMMIILPGVYAGREGGHGTTFKKIALERGMNYAILANPMEEESISDEPARHPGNLQTEAEATYHLMKALKKRKPKYFDKVSLAGYSYGGLLAANVTRLDEAAGKEGERLIQGGVIALSPPENMHHSMHQLDGLREGYASGAGSATAQGLVYMTEVDILGYERFMESHLAERNEENNQTEIKMSDVYGSRDSMKDMVVQVDKEFGHDQLPPSFPYYFERRRILNNMTYDQYSKEWFSKDPWLGENNLTPEQLGEKTSFSRALNDVKETPFVTLVSSDDYILNSEDVKEFEKLSQQTESLEHTEVFETGGHVGILFNPKVQDFIGDFAYSAATTEIAGRE